jgi:PAS domain S-box-containing protein
MGTMADKDHNQANFVELATELATILDTMRSHPLPDPVLGAADAFCSKFHRIASAHGDSASALQEARRALSESTASFGVLTNAMPQMVWSTLPDGFHDFYNARWYEFTGVPEGSTDGEGWAGMFHPDDQDHAWAAWRHSLATGDPYEVEYRLRKWTGEYRWTLGRALPVRDPGGQIVRWIGTCTDIDDVKQAAERNEVLRRELSHRIKNIFAVVGSLISLSARRSPEAVDYAVELQNRIAALGRAHEFVSPQSDPGETAVPNSSLHAILRQILSPYIDAERRIRISGDDTPVDDRGATPIALIFHELATNAAKYGALSMETGVVDITTQLVDGRICTVWQEHGGPVVQGAPEATGFGSKLTKISAEQQLGGSIERHWRPDGLRVEITMQLSGLAQR